jgi:hypothetical protein
MSTVEKFVNDGLPYKIRFAATADGRYNALFAYPCCNLASVSAITCLRVRRLMPRLPGF